MTKGGFTKSEIDRLRDSVRISDIIGRYVTWDRKKTSIQRGDYWGNCCFHGEKSPSFHCEDRKGRYHCFGCGASGDVFRFLVEKTGCTFPEAVEMLGGQREIREETDAEKARRQRQEQERRDKDQREKENSEQFMRGIARKIWNETIGLEGTIGHQYFIGRDIGFAVQFPALRFHPKLEYRDKEKTIIGQFPAVVAGLQAPDDGRFLGIWRIYLDDHGNKNKAVPNAKVGLGQYAEYGGCVRLGEPAGQKVHPCEGIETGLGIYGITGAVVCPALNTSGLENFIPPRGATGMLIWPDGDVDRIRNIGGAEKKVQSPGQKAAQVLQQRTMERVPDFPVSIQPTPRNGRDYLDVWQAMKRKMK